jgi:predicted transcriptional regulator
MFKYRLYNISDKIMINPYEMVSKSALPALRAMVAKRLREDYHLTQQQVAERLGVTQASVSNYTRKARGVMIDLEADSNVAKAADRVAKLLSPERPDQRNALAAMTEVCDYVRFSHLMCNLHRELDPEFKAQGCEACDGVFTGKGFDRLKVLAGP